MGERTYFAAGKKIIVAPVPAPADPEAFIKAQAARSKTMPDKVEGLHHLLRSLGSVEFLPAYPSVQGDRPDQMLTLLEAVLDARRRSPDSFKPKTVIVLFSDLTDSDVARLEKKLAEDPALRGRAVSLSISDKSVGDALARPGEVVLLRVGAVTQEVFDYFFSRQTLPGVVAGVNSQNLSLLLGRPFIQSNNESVAIDDILRSAGPDSARVILDAFNAFNGSPLPDGLSRSEAIARFLIEAKRSDSGLRRGFASLRPVSPADDKIAQLLDRAAALYEASHGERPISAVMKPTEGLYYQGAGRFERLWRAPLQWATAFAQKIRAGLKSAA